MSDDDNLMNPRHSRSPFNKYNWDGPFSIRNPRSPNYNPNVGVSGDEVADMVSSLSECSGDLSGALYALWVIVFVMMLIAAPQYPLALAAVWFGWQYAKKKGWDATVTLFLQIVAIIGSIVILTYIAYNPIIVPPH